MRKIALFVAAVTMFVLIGIATWIHVGTPTPTSAIAGPIGNAPVRNSMCDLAPLGPSVPGARQQLRPAATHRDSKRHAMSHCN
jgi:hypothetical protein